MDSTEAFSSIQDILLEFRAGRMLMEGKRVIPDSRKGLVRIGRGEEGLIHLQWLDRTNNSVEDDQIVFPEEAVFEKVNQASGRVYILKFNTDDRKCFFWMQEPIAENDTELCNSVNFYLNQPLEFPVEDEPEMSIPLPTSEDMADDDISSSVRVACQVVTLCRPLKLKTMKHLMSKQDNRKQRLRDMLTSLKRAGNLIGSSMGAEVTSDVSSSGPVKLADLQRILSNIGSSDAVVDPDAGLGLGDILKPEFILPLIDTSPLEEGLASHLPEGPWTRHDLMELLQSPPFRQQVDSFTYVLRTGQIDLTQFGVDPSKYKFTVLSFLEALEDSVAKTSQSCNQNDAMEEGQ